MHRCVLSGSYVPWVEKYCIDVTSVKAMPPGAGKYCIDVSLVKAMPLGFGNIA